MSTKPQLKFEKSLKAALKLHTLGKLEEAIKLYHELIELFPEKADLWHLLGVAAHQKGENLLAENLIKTALELNEESPDYFNNLGMVYKSLNRPDDAKLAFSNAIKIDSTYAKAYSNLGSLLRTLGDFDKALQYCREAIKLNPGDIEGLNNLGNALWDSGKCGEATETYRTALELDPNFALTHWNLSLALLAAGEFKEGFQHFTRRWDWDKFPGKKRLYRQPQWSGENILEKVILLHPEQGLGDTIQFMRFSALVKTVAKHVILELPKEVAPLAIGAGLAHEIVATGEICSEFDCHAYILDLPYRFGITRDTIPQNLPYLKIDRALKEKWENRIQQYDGLKIGLNWYGNSANPVEKFRKIPITELAKLFKIPQIEWFNLQKGENSAEERHAHSLGLIDTGLRPLMETAALISVLDLIITSDTAIAHLAGALGKPVWILLHHSPDWRWQITGKRSIWYPSADLFRQSKPGEWNQVVNHIRTKLLNLL